ncbi:hypothetical protein E4N62_39945 [Streptomyces sp. MNU76]|uniref:hypothetical protein n=1 Tax=Streptomyces sp. MNU76 TaxID=2560026 RepID=UPI001E576926|nr:hypothetical protein [Streptomyces sp. MNU76]MCC9710869.1 hypothetical protein [Streptomyces sp. MNU76]
MPELAGDPLVLPAAVRTDPAFTLGAVAGAEGVRVEAEGLEAEFLGVEEQGAGGSGVDIGVLSAVRGRVWWCGRPRAAVVTPVVRTSS